jgi:nucleoside-diphosphate-sugar epimerase
VLDAFEKTIIPAVRGTETLLFSALKSGSQLSSVVVTSSVAAISNPSVEPGHVFTESEFASFAFDRTMSDHKDGLKTPPGILYGASKTAADRATWKFRNEHKVII